MHAAGSYCGSRLSGFRATAREKTTFMADIKFSCGQCGQHISGGEQWAGHQLQCPACHAVLVVPQVQQPPAAVGPAPRLAVPQPPPAGAPRLAAGATQVARSTAPGPAPRQQPLPRSPKTGNPVLKFAVIGVVLIALGGAGYVYVPKLLNQVQDAGTSKTPAPANASSGGGGPLGEVNGAMDISETLDGGASSRPAPAAPPATPQPAATRPQAAPQPAAARQPAVPATNSAARPAHKRPGKS
jgi:hypothetical protein